MDDIENYRFYNEPNPKCKKKCVKIHKKHHHPCVDDHPPHKHHHHHHHKEHPPFFEHDEPDYDKFFLKHNPVVLQGAATATNGDGTITIKAYVRDKYGNKIDDGKISYYLEAGENDEQTITRQYIGTSDVQNGTSEYTWIIPDNISTGEKLIYITYQEFDDYISAERYITAIVQKGVIVTVDDVQASHGKQNVPFVAHVTDLNKNPINEGRIQFVIDTYDLGTSVPVINGIATYILEEVPTTFKDQSVIKAYFHGTDTYADSIKNPTGIFTLLEQTKINISQISVNPGETTTIEATITDNTGENPITEGEYNIYFDDKLIQNGQLDSSGKISCEITSEFTTIEGEHTILIEFLGNETYDDLNNQSKFIVRQQVTIIMDDVEGSLDNKLKLTSHITCDDQPVNTGEVTYYIEY